MATKIITNFSFSYQEMVEWSSSPRLGSRKGGDQSRGSLTRFSSLSPAHFRGCRIILPGLHPWKRDCPPDTLYLAISLR